MTHILIAFLSALALLFLTWFFLFEYRAYRIRVFRFHLFEARDQLFERARLGELKFEDRAYGMARTLINGLLRRAESLSLPHMLLLQAIASSKDQKVYQEKFAERFEEARGKLTLQGKVAVDEALHEAHFCVLSHMLHISVVFAIPILVLKAWVRLRVYAGMEYALAIQQEKRRTEKNAQLSILERQLSFLDDEAYDDAASSTCLDELRVA